MNMLIMGGDARSAYLAQIAADAGWNVRARYMEKFSQALPEGRAEGPWDAAVLPYPSCEKDGVLWTPLSCETVPMHAAMQEVGQAHCIVGGQGTALWWVDACNPGADEGFVLENAAITAEGAVACAMRDGHEGILRAQCVILGCGRIARFLAHKLSGLGADIIMAARKDRDRAYALANGWRAVSFEARTLGDVLAAADFVFNTVPHPVLDEALLRAIRPDAVLYELASAPYGFSMDTAKRIGVDARLESGLPGRYAPKAAARALYHVIERRLKEAEGHA